MNRRFKTILPALLCTAALGACSHMPASVRGAIEGVTPASSSDDRVHAAMDLLERGEEDRAKSQLEAVLRRDPGNHTARRLLDEINIDPRTQLGARNRPYVVREGDTMSMLAQRHLGDPLLFYALARYNDMAPRDLAAGQTIRMPDRGRASVPSTLRASSTRPSATPPATTAAVTPPVTPPVAAAPTEASVRANRLRLQALEHLNAGDATTAVNLLQQARALDSGNAAIQRDLARAQRIQASLRTQ